ncbi:MAG: hypothetical protein WKG01_15205 [Kofleriaceae bacterium]
MAIFRHFESLRSARDAAGVEHPPQARKWSLDRVVDELKRVYASGVDTTASALLTAGRQDLVVAIYTYVRSIVRARRMAKIPPPRRRWSEAERWDEERVIAEIIACHANGESIAASKAPSKLLCAGQRYFKTWRNAVESAGFDYDEILLLRRPYAKQEICELLRKLARDRPSIQLAELYDHRSYSAMIRLYGSLPRAVRAAGLGDWPVPRYKKWSRRRVIAELRARAAAGIRRSDATLQEAATLYFGSMRAARAAARVPQLRGVWSKERVVTELRALGERFPDRNLAVACERLFGGVVAARRAAGVAAPPPKWSAERVIEVLRTRARGGELSVEEPLLSACLRQFGTLAAARRAAGVDEIVAAWPKTVLLEVVRGLAPNWIRGAVATRCVRLFGSAGDARLAAGVPERGF